MDPNIIWAIALIAVGAALIILELFIPSGGLIGVASVGCFIGATYLGYQAGEKTGLVILCSSVLVVGVMIYMALKIWPHTPMGRNALPTDENPADTVTKALEHLVGLRGVSTSTLMPNGRIEIDGKTYDAVSQGTIIEEGFAIEVLSIESNRILVTQVEQSPSDQQSTGDRTDTTVEYSTFEDDLEQSLGDETL
ncbi:MAG: hypothetical protein CMJ76_09845 [Planctomycetaceae bacterium]|nr:hypothetical protein [Planctomycetaceae bacterium]|tara:strand:+ start:1565 stop:2146 length:582 start_codon:yes stop_codon:yes gene_type:complete